MPNSLIRRSLDGGPVAKIKSNFCVISLTRAWACKLSHSMARETIWKKIFFRSLFSWDLNMSSCHICAYIIEIAVNRASLHREFPKYKMTAAFVCVWRLLLRQAMNERINNEIQMRKTKAKSKKTNEQTNGVQNVWCNRYCWHCHCYCYCFTHNANKETKKRRVNVCG